MLFLIALLLLALYAAVYFITRPYRTGQKPITFSTVVDVPSDKVEQVYTQVRDAQPSFLHEKYETEPDGTLVITALLPFGGKEADVLFTNRCERVGGTDLCPIYRVFDADGEAYPFGLDHYSTSAFAPIEGKTILTIEETCQNVSIMGFLFVRFIIKRTLAAQVRKLHELINEEQNPKRHTRAEASSPQDEGRTVTDSIQTSFSERAPEPTKPSKASWAPGSAGTAVRSSNNRDFMERHKNELILSLLAVGSFILMFGLEGGLLLAPLILLHEYGHLLGYQLTGQKGNRLMLVPFFGGLAIANEAHKTEFNRAFCALMGPGICAPVSVALAFAAVAVGDHWTWWWLAYAAMLCGMGNALNMVPMMPFDGGHIMQSVARSLSRGQAQAAMMVMSAGGGVILMQAGYENFAYITFAWLATSMFQSENTVVDPEALNVRSGLTIAAMYGIVLACHAGAALFIYGRFY